MIITEYYEDKYKGAPEGVIEHIKYEIKSRCYDSRLERSVHEAYRKDVEDDTITNLIMDDILGSHLAYITVKLENNRFKIVYWYDTSLSNASEDLLYETMLRLVPYPMSFKRIPSDRRKAFLLMLKREYFEGDIDGTKKMIDNVLWRSPNSLYNGRSRFIIDGKLTIQAVAWMIVHYPEVYDNYLVYHRLRDTVRGKELFLISQEKYFDEHVIPNLIKHTFILKNGNMHLYCPYCKFFPECMKRDNQICYKTFSRHYGNFVPKKGVKFNDLYMDELQRFIRLVFLTKYFPREEVLKVV